MNSSITARDVKNRGLPASIRYVLVGFRPLMASFAVLCTIFCLKSKTLQLIMAIQFSGLLRDLGFLRDFVSVAKTGAGKSAHRTLKLANQA